MTRKTTITAPEGQQGLTITRDFELPVAALFRAYTEPALIEQWMGTRVLRHENRPHGSWQFETTDAAGQVVFRAHGVIHDFVPEQRITRTFEMENGAFGVQLEFLEFAPLGAASSRLTIYSVYRSVAQRDQLLRLPFAQGLNLAHNRLQAVAASLT